VTVLSGPPAGAVADGHHLGLEDSGHARVPRAVQQMSVVGVRRCRSAFLGDVCVCQGPPGRERVLLPVVYVPLFEWVSSVRSAHGLSSKDGYLRSLL